MNTFLLDPEKTASFDVDAQNTFTPVCPNELPVVGGTEIVDELNAQAAFARLRLGSKDAHSPSAVWVADENHPPLSAVAGEPNVDIRWPRHAEPGTKGFELINGLPSVTDYDYFVWKGVEPNMHPYGACYHDLANRMSTGVIEYLRAQGIQTVLVGGLATDYCIKNTVLQLNQAGFEVVVNRAAVRGVAEETSAQAVTEMEAAGVILVESAAQLKRRDVRVAST
ncbi:MAG: isochorismatase family protein [Candidatus Competibacteraceae bacterium]|jgi:nicotinamidase/pyrazinamidase|nr:isochorismatase family protein [Candidatus Competibacteraceae bacterium]